MSNIYHFSKKIIKSYTPESAIGIYRHIQAQIDRRFFKRHLKASDVFLVGHPKSGNTWLSYMLANVIFGSKERQITLANIGKYVPLIHGKDSSIAKYPNLSKPRIFRNEQPLYPELYPKTIYLIRDPRAVLVSYYHMYRITFNDNKRNLQSFIDEYLSQGCIKKWEILPRWDRQVSAWIQRSQKSQNIMIIKYEDMVDNRKYILKKAIDFSNIVCSEYELEVAVEQGKFENMRSVEEKYGAESYPGKIGERGRFIRKGKINGWKQEMSQSIEKRIEREFGPIMELTGYS